MVVKIKPFAVTRIFPFLIIILISVCQTRTEEIDKDHQQEEPIHGDDDDGDGGGDGDVIIPSVVTSDVGGWPSAITGAPFYVGEIVTCCEESEVALTGGVDHLSSHCNAECVVVEYDSSGTSGSSSGSSSSSSSSDKEEITVQCNRGINDTLPVECCERYIEGDFPVYRLNNGLHFTGWASMTSVFNGMSLLEKDYPTVQYDGSVIFLNYRDFYKHARDIPCNVPIRVQNSRNYKTIYRSLDSPESWSLESKREVAKRSVGNSASDVFPPTYLSCHEALEKTVNDTYKLLFVKQDGRAWGEGIAVVSRSELQSMYEQDEVECESGFGIIQEAIEDLAVISGSRFDIRFYVLIHNGKVYLHENASFKWQLGTQFDPKSTESTLEFVRKFFPGKEGELVSVFTSKDRIVTKPFMDAIYQALVDTLPIMEEVMNITGQDPTLYHIYGGDAMIRNNGKAMFTEFNDWPNADWYGGLTTALVDSTTIGPISDDGPEYYDRFVAEMHADFFAIVLGLAVKSNGGDIPLNGYYLCEGRVREAVEVDESGIPIKSCNASTVT